MHTIAITGATGFIGKHLVAELLRLGGFRIKLLTRAKNSLVNSLIESGVVVVEGDLLNLESLNGFLEKVVLLSIWFIFMMLESKKISKQLITCCICVKLQSLNV